VKKKVYIASPYTKGDIAVNVKRQIDVADELMTLGYAPFVPLYSHFQHMVHPRPYTDWVEIDLEWVPVCDAPMVSYGDAGSAARFFYCAKAGQEDREEGLSALAAKAREARYGTVQDGRPHTPEGYEYSRAPRKNHHPTVKPTDLMRYLCRLVTPKGGTVLDPFAGSGSTGKAAMLEGFNFIGIDLTAEYVEIARARIEFALRQGHQPSLLEAIA
jgi:hypothetical protein